MVGLASKVLLTIKKYGGVGAVKKACEHFIYRRDHDVKLVRRFDDIGSQPLHAKTSFTIEALTDCRDPIANFLSRDQPGAASSLFNYIKLGCVVHVLISDEKVIGFMVTAIEDFYDSNHYRQWFRLAPGEGYCFGFFVLPSARKGDGARLLMYEAFRWLKFNRSLTSIYALCDTKAPALLRFYRVNKFQQTDEAIDHYTVFGLHLSRATKFRGLPVRTSRRK